MVHVGHTPAPLGEILSELRPGDLLTHCFHGKKHGILDKNGAVLSEVREAIEQGILFDVGHGLGSFSFDVAAQAMEQGMTPATISSDLHFYTLHGPVFDLATTVSKFLLLGMRLDEALAKVTVAPARILGLKGQLGSLGEGCLADIAIFDVRVGEFSFRDSMGKCLTGREALEPVAVVKAGRIYRSDLWCNRRTLHLDEDLKSISP
jgi:dihydroorotase